MLLVILRTENKIQFDCKEIILLSVSVVRLDKER